MRGRACRDRRPNLHRAESAQDLEGPRRRLERTRDDPAVEVELQATNEKVGEQGEGRREGRGEEEGRSAALRPLTTTRTRRTVFLRIVLSRWSFSQAKVPLTVARTKSAQRSTRAKARRRRDHEEELRRLTLVVCERDERRVSSAAGRMARTSCGRTSTHDGPGARPDRLSERPGVQLVRRRRVDDRVHRLVGDVGEVARRRTDAKVLLLVLCEVAEGERRKEGGRGEGEGEGVSPVRAIVEPCLVDARRQSACRSVKRS